MKINIDMLGQAIALALAQFKVLYGNEVEVSPDYYWTLPYPEKIDMSQVPEPLVGSLSDHLEVVEGLGRGEIDPYPLALRDLGEVMRRCGEADFPVLRS